MISVHKNLHLLFRMATDMMYTDKQTVLLGCQKNNVFVTLASVLHCFEFIYAVKPKFHYADFATKSVTSSRQSRRLVADANQESRRRDLCRGLS